MMQLSDRDYSVMRRGLALLRGYVPSDRKGGEARRLALCLLRKIERRKDSGHER